MRAMLCCKVLLHVRSSVACKLSFRMTDCVDGIMRLINHV